VQQVGRPALVSNPATKSAKAFFGKQRQAQEA
jgi:hypothetical protein